MKNRILTRIFGFVLATCVMGTTLSPTVMATEFQSIETVEEECITVDITEFSSIDETTAYLQTNPSNGLRLIVVSDCAPRDFYGATSVVTYDGVWMMNYTDSEALNVAYEAYQREGFPVELDESVESFEADEIISDITLEDVPESSVESQAEDTSQIVAAEELNVEKSITVAIIDTGVETNNEVIEGRLSTSMADGMSDANGHGTLMAEIIAAQTSENVQILPIAAFDENGKSSVAKLYFAIKEAMNQGADVINISACGAGESKVLSSVIAQATARDIVVVVAAGNESSDTAGYMPANVCDAITVSAVDKERAFAAYSNYGDNVDFSAMGILVKDMGTEDEADDLVYMGTSISAAYVSSYAALLLAERTEVDVYASLLASAIDLGEEGFDAYFGHGYLEKENIVAVIREAREKTEEENEEDDFEDDLMEEGDEELYVAQAMENIYGEHNFLSLMHGQISDANGKRRDQFFLLGGDPVSDNGVTYSGRLYKDLKIGNGVFYLGIESGEFGTYQEAKEHFEGSWGMRTGCPESSEWMDIHATGNGTYQYNVGKHDTNRKVVFSNCTFGNCYFECYFDVEFRNCTFVNCHIQSNGRGNQTYINCELSGCDDWDNTYYRGDTGIIYSGVIGGNCSDITLRGTTIYGNTGNIITNGDGGTHGACSITVMDGSKIYGDAGVTKACIRDTGDSGCTIIVQDSLLQTGDTAVYVSPKSTCTIGAGAIINDMKRGITNKGVTNLHGGIIQNGRAGVSSAGIYNENILSQTAGMIRNHTNGVVNNKTMYLTGGEIKGNTSNGVYQNGYFEMSSNAKVDLGNVIYLNKGKVITVKGLLNAAEAGRIHTASGDRATGRVLVQLVNNTQGEQTASKFRLAFTTNDNMHQEDLYDENGTKRASKGSFVQSDIRAGYGSNQNAPTNQIILSGWYYANFEANLPIAEGMTVHIPYRGNKFRYGEKYLPATPSHAYTTGAENKVTVEVTRKDGSTVDISNTLGFQGWALNPKETDESKIYTTDQTMTMYGDFHWYAIWDTNFDILFEGNGQTQGANYRKDNMGFFDPLPGNVGPDGVTLDYFAKEDVYKAADRTWYDKNKEAYIDHSIPYSYQGWSLRKDATYKNSDVVKPKNPSKDTLAESFGITSYNEGVKWLIDLIAKDINMGFDDDGRAIIPLYVVWDRSPQLEAYDIYITRDELDSLTEADLWENVAARDYEDGTLKNRVDVKVIDFDRDAFRALEGDRGGMSITYQAEDGAGNVTFYPVMMHVTSNMAITSWTQNRDGKKRDTANYVRFIDRENYNKYVASEGGMEEHSVWYTRPEYVNLITTAFHHLAHQSSVISYELDAKTMQDIQKYNHEHRKDALESAFRRNFYDQFLAPNTVSGVLPSHNEE